MSGPQGTPPPILLYSDRRLRGICREVGPEEQVDELVARLDNALRKAGGVGLAAPQLGDQRRVLVLRPPGSAAAPPQVMINPRLESGAGPLVPCEEGCLSFPGLFLTLWRPRAIRVSYRNRAGRPDCLEIDGLPARIVQHELDHLDGVLFIDRLPRWRRWLLAWRLGQLRQRARESAA